MALSLNNLLDVLQYSVVYAQWRTDSVKRFLDRRETTEIVAPRCCVPDSGLELV